MGARDVLREDCRAVRNRGVVGAGAVVRQYRLRGLHDVESRVSTRSRMNDTIKNLAARILQLVVDVSDNCEQTGGLQKSPRIALRSRRCCLIINRDPLARARVGR